MMIIYNARVYEEEMFMSIKMKFKRLVKDYAKNHKNFRKFAKAINYKYETTKYLRGLLNIETDEKLIYFSTFNGKGYSDSPKAIYEAMLKDSRFNDYKFVWVFEDPEKYKYLESNRNTSLVKRLSKEEIDVIKRAGYWITNYRMLDFYIPKDNQKYIQCWHGTPLKRLGFDLKNSANAMNSAKEIYEKYARDTERFTYFISPGKWASSKFRTAWNMKYYGKEDSIIEEGYPRNDMLLNATEQDVEEIKTKLNLTNIGSKKIILYAPTWRDNQYTKSIGYTYEANVNFDLLEEELSEGFIILFRAHYLVANQFNFEKYKGFVYDVSEHSDINELYLISDMLITDYSSVFFDYANLKRPIIYYMYDFEEYRDELRGFYLSLDELPGPIVKTEEDLIRQVKRLDYSFEIDEKYRKFNDKFNYLDDGKASERVIERIFFGNEKSNN